MSLFALALTVLFVGTKGTGPNYDKQPQTKICAQGYLHIFGHIGILRLLTVITTVPSTNATITTFYY